MAKRVVLHYGGEKYELPEDQSDALDGIEDETGTVSLNAGGGKWLTFIVGPGIPALLETWEEKPPAIPRQIR